MAKAKKDKYPKNYTSKLSKTNRRVMYKLAGGWCLEVIRRLEGKTGSGEHLNCHSNVQDFVDRIGGERVEGWVKTPVPGTSKAGVTLWAFHSLWKTPEGELVDCTQSQHLLDEKTAIFWLDEKRSVDLEEGVGHGAVAVFERDEGIRGRETYNGKRLEKGKGYWMNDNSNPAFASFTAAANRGSGI